MYQKDPIQHAEEIIKTVHDKAGKYTQPVLGRYPLVFAFLVVFSVAAIIHGFGDLVAHIPLFSTHPGALMLLGILALFLTGKLYRWLEKGSE